MTDTRNDRTEQPVEKKPYNRPELITHGTVESQTQVTLPPSTSRPN